MKKASLTQGIVTKVRRMVYSTLGLVFKQAPIAIYCYHSISSDDWRYSVSLEMLKQQIEFLMSHYDPISMSDLSDYLDGKKETTKPSFILAFDDGYQDLLCIKDYLPSLGIKPIVFVLAQPDKANRSEISATKPFLANDEIISLHQAGWDIGCHSATHADFRNLDAGKIKSEIIDAKSTLEANLKIPIKYFAYPKGNYTPGIADAVRLAGFTLAFSMDHQIIRKQSNHFTLPRVGVDHTHTLSEFRGIGTSATIRAKSFGAKLLKEGIYD